jgi:xanthine dehydrogenase accessory factor
MVRNIKWPTSFSALSVVLDQIRYPFQTGGRFRALDELDTILNGWRVSQHEGSEAILATVVDVAGSAYRRPGARMLILPNGKRIGSISGGCLEGDLVKKAWWYTEISAAPVRTYDTTSDAETSWEFGLGCNGIVHVMLERTKNRETHDLLNFLSNQRIRESPAVVATVIRVGGGDSHREIKIGDRLFFSDGTIEGGSLVGSVVETKVASYAATAATLRTSHLTSIDAIEVFIEYVGTPTRLFVFGAGHDAIPLVRTAGLLGWKTTVAENRAAYTK